MKKNEITPDIESQKNNLLRRLSCLHGSSVLNEMNRDRIHETRPLTGNYILGEEYYIDSNPSYLFMRDINGRKCIGAVVSAKVANGNEYAKVLDFDILDVKVDEYDQSLLRTGRYCYAKTIDFHDVFDIVSRCRTYLDVWNLIKGKRIKVSAVNTVNVARHNAANQVIGTRTFHVPVFTFVKEGKTNDCEYFGSDKNAIAQENQVRNVLEASNAIVKNIELDLHPIKKCGSWGFANKEGKIVIPCQWKYAFSFSEGLAYVEDFDNRHYYINNNGKVEIISIWPWADAYVGGLARIRDENMKYGFMDKRGTVIIPCKWNFVHRFYSGLALVQDKFGKYGFIDKNGKEVISCQWRRASDFVEGFAMVEDIKSKWGYINKLGILVIPCIWSDAKLFSEGFACVKEPYVNVLNPGKYGYIDTSGKVIIPFKWKHADRFIDGIALVEDEFNMFGYIDKTGKEIIPCKWLDAGVFSEGLAYVKDSNGKYGYIDVNGDVVIPCTWDFAHDFNNGYAKVRNNKGVLSLIDRSGYICD